MARRIAFDRSLYLQEAVEAAAAAYAEHAQIAVSAAGDTLEAVLTAVDQGDEDVVANSFCNHVLYETIVRLRQTSLREVV